MKLKQIYTVIIVSVVLILLSVPACAQDLLARQAPVDRRMRTVDTLSIQSIIEREMTENPSAQLYDDWNNVYAHRATELPDSFRINLRNFCMPTTNRVITSKMGPRWGRMHKGLDIKVYIGDTIRAAFSGKVRIKKYERAGSGSLYNRPSEFCISRAGKVRDFRPIAVRPTGGVSGALRPLRMRQKYAAPAAQNCPRAAWQMFRRNSV